MLISSLPRDLIPSDFYLLILNSLINILPAHCCGTITMIDQRIKGMWDSFLGGTGRRLRDRDLLRKRKAEAEERAINQWVYG